MDRFFVRWTEKGKLRQWLVNNEDELHAFVERLESNKKRKCIGNIVYGFSKIIIDNRSD